jgi:hypothetical protein
VQRHVLYLGEISPSQAAAWRKSIEVFDEDAGHARTLALFPEDRAIAAASDNSIVQLRLSEMRLCRPRLCCMDVGYEGARTQFPNPVCSLRDMDILRAPKPQHSVQGSRGEGDLGRLSLVGARSKGIANHALVPADRRLDLGPQIVAAGFLPDHAAALGDHLQMAVALCRAVSAGTFATAPAHGGTMMAAAGLRSATAWLTRSWS